MKKNTILSEKLKGYDKDGNRIYSIVALRGKVKRKFISIKKINKNKTVEELESGRLYKKKWSANNVQKTRDYRKKWNDNNKIKTKAHQDVFHALLNNEIEKQPCLICGELKVEAHHEDYAKPLEVMWLCRSHHSEQHANKKRKLKV